MVGMGTGLLINAFWIELAIGSDITPIISTKSKRAQQKNRSVIV